MMSAGMPLHFSSLRMSFRTIANPERHSNPHLEKYIKFSTSNGSFLVLSRYSRVPLSMMKANRSRLIDLWCRADVNGIDCRPCNCWSRRRWNLFWRIHCHRVYRAIETAADVFRISRRRQCYCICCGTIGRRRIHATRFMAMVVLRS
jgi:hypothetical protein